MLTIRRAAFGSLPGPARAYLRSRKLLGFAVIAWPLCIYTWTFPAWLGATPIPLFATFAYALAVFILAIRYSRAMQNSEWPRKFAIISKWIAAPLAIMGLVVLLLLLLLLFLRRLFSGGSE